jgi:hypothetical protein
MVIETLAICATVVAVFGMYLWDRRKTQAPAPQTKDWSEEIEQLRADLKKVEVRVTKENVSRLLR